jgi:hypothetical protein
MAFDWGQAFSGGAGGAASGATIGSLLPGPGTAIGAALGGIGGFIGGGKGSQKAQNKRMELSPQAQNIINQLQGGGLSLLQNPTQGFQPIANRAQTMFNQQTVPGLAERFTAAGGGSLSSPAFASMQTQAGLDLAERLAALEAQYGQQGIGNALQMLSMGLQPEFDQYREPAQNFGLDLLQAGGQALPTLMQTLSSPTYKEQASKNWSWMRPKTEMNRLGIEPQGAY